VREDSRQSDDDEVEPVPSVAQEREVSQDEASSQDLRQTFGRVDGREYFSDNTVRAHQVQAAARQPCAHTQIQDIYFCLSKSADQK